MADDLISQISQIGGSLPGWGALAAFGGLALRLGRHIGVYEKTRESQDGENKRLGAGLDKVVVALDDHKGKTDARFQSHAQDLTETRLALAKLPDRDEIRALFDDLRADIKSAGPTARRRVRI